MLRAPGGAQGNEGARCREQRWLLVGVGGVVFPAVMTPPHLTVSPASCSEHPGGAGVIKSPLEYAPGVRGAPLGSKHPLPQTKPPELLQIFIGGGKKQKREGPGVPHRHSAATHGDPSSWSVCSPPRVWARSTCSSWCPANGPAPAEPNQPPEAEGEIAGRETRGEVLPPPSQAPVSIRHKKPCPHFLLTSVLFAWVLYAFFFLEAFVV